MLTRLRFKTKSAFRQSWKILANIPKIVRLVPAILQDGGYTSIKVAQVNYGELLSGKRILITGGSSGIGFAIARKALELGAIVVITGRDASKIKKAANELNHQNLKTLLWDVSKFEKLKLSHQEALALLGGDVDILVNNAGVLSNEFFPNVTEDDWDRVYDVNSKGLYLLTQEVYKRWISSQRSPNVRKIINISSQGGFVGATHPYRMTKWDVVGFTQGLAIALATKGIIVNGIAPGIVATSMQKEYLNRGGNNYCGLNPVRRIALAEEIAELAAFLISDASNFIVGQTIVCDGGYSIK